MMYAYLQTGQDAAARRLLESLPEMSARLDPAAMGPAPPMAGYFAMGAIPARYALERGAWTEAAKLQVLRSPFPWTEAMTHFARALGAARTGDSRLPKAEIAALERIRDQLADAREAYWSEQVEIERRGAAAWLALTEGRKDEALAGMRVAADREDATEKSAVTPGPLAPARELLGEMLLELGEPSLALKEFERTLQTEPNRFRALAGAAKAASATGDRGIAKKYDAQMLKSCERADRPGRRELNEAAKAISGSP
jgi:tetratricopeptide (TPR) repeat protein